MSAFEQNLDYTIAAAATSVTIFGYGSLMDASSCKRTMPNSKNYRKAMLRGYKRVFSLVSISGIRKGAMLPYVAALAIRKASKSDYVLGSAFEIPREELSAYLEREARYRADLVTCEYLPCVSDVASTNTFQALTVIEQSNEEYLEKLVATGKSYQQEVGQYYAGNAVWGRNDILPMYDYLNLCLRSARETDPQVEENMLHHTLLADGSTNLITYIKSETYKSSVGAYRLSSL